MGRDNVKNNLADDPIRQISEFVLKRKFPELFESESQSIFEIELSPNRNLWVTEPSVYDYESNGKITLVCETCTKGNPSFESSQITTDRDGIITGVTISDRSEINIGKNEGINTEADLIKNSFLADFPPDVIVQLRKIGKEYYSKMQPLIRERNRVVARILEVMFENS